MHAVQLDYVSQDNHTEPLEDARLWVEGLEANVQVAIWKANGPAGGHPILVFYGEAPELVKVLRDYHADDAEGYAQALEALIVGD